MEYEFVLTGTSALLMHADNIMRADDLTAWRKNPKNKSISVPGDDRSPPWTWTVGLYHDTEHITMPVENIMAALRGAGAKVSAKRGSFKSMSQSGLFIPGDFCKFTTRGQQISMASIIEFEDAPFLQHVEEVNKLGFDLLIKRARIGSSKHVRVRAMFKIWEVSGTVRVVEPAITPDILGQLFEIAGNRIGLGDWRPGSPGSPGTFGMFSAMVTPANQKQIRKAS